MRTFFVGAFNDIRTSCFSGSAAGAKVQTEIVDALGLVGEEVEAYIMPEIPCWPKGRFLKKGCSEVNMHFLPVVNVAFIKRATFFLQVAFYIAIEKPRRVIFYNSSIAGCLLSILLKPVKCQTILILQDVNGPLVFDVSLLASLRKCLNYLSARLLPISYDYYIPITRSCISDLGLPLQRSVIFSGGVSLGKIYNDESSVQLDNYGVFAGALEQYNGVDLLVDKWPAQDRSPYKLHIFGSGSLSAYIVEAAKNNDNLIFHGFKPPSVVAEYLRSSRFNFCLRYSKGLNQSYFFPSKFFELILLPGIFVCNRFENIPSEFLDHIRFVGEDLSDLCDVISAEVEVAARERAGLVNTILERFTWCGFFKSFFKKVDSGLSLV